MTEDGLPDTLAELCDYILKHADAIHVREKLDGKWGSHALSALPATLALKHAFRWIKNIQVPIRILSAEGQEELREKGKKAR